MKAGHKKPTQSDVARLAAVSTATVSRVINSPDAVAPAVRQRVEEAIARLDYLPHAGARALAMQRSGTLGAIIPTLNNAIFADGINGFEQAARELGYTLILAVSDASQPDHLYQLGRMIERGVDGLMLVGNDHPELVFDRLEKASVRHVCAWAFDEQAPAANIGFDNALAMRPVVDHLIGLGHQHIGMLAGVSEHNDRARERIRGVTAALKVHDVALSDRRIIEVPYSIKASRLAFREIIKNDLSAIVCGNDVIAYGACLEALKTGLRIPQDISITGFDNLPLSSELSPSLTTINVEAARMGEQAARELIRAVENRDRVASCRLDTSLVVRETTGSCR